MVELLVERTHTAALFAGANVGAPVVPKLAFAGVVRAVQAVSETIVLFLGTSRIFYSYWR